MSSSVGDILLKLKLNSSGFNKSLSEIQGKANTVGSKISSSFAGIGKMALKAFSVAAVTAFSKKCIDAVNAQTEAETKLSVVMRQRMKASEDTINSVKKLTSSQQELGVIGDEVQLAGAQQLSTFLNNDEALKSLIPAMNNLAAQQKGVNATSDDMVNIGNLMGKVMQGQTSALTRVGITFDEAQEKILKYGTEEQKAATLAQVITDNVGNMNAAIANTPAGKIKQLKNSFGDMMESLGRGLQNVFSPMLTFINAAIAKLSQLANTFESFTAKIFGNANKNSVATGGIANNISDAVSNQEELTEATAKTNKEAQRGVASFDKLNVISSQKADDASQGGSSSSGGGAASVPISNNNADSDISNKFKKQFQGLYEKSGCKAFIQKVQGGLNSVDWSSIERNCKKSFEKSKPIIKAYAQGVAKAGESALGALGSYVGGVVKVTGKSFQTLTGGVSKWLDKDGDKIEGFVESYYNNISKGFDNLSTFFDGWFDIVGNSVDRMRPIMEEAISNLLSGFTDFGIILGSMISEGFVIATQSLVDWVNKDGAVIGEFFDNMQAIVADTFNFIGQVFSDTAEVLSDWWNGDGKGIFKNVCDMFLNVGTTLMNVWNEWIMPVWDFIVGVATDAWNNCLKPIFEKAVSFIGKLADYISTVWNNFLSPVVNWIVKVMGPKITNTLNWIRGVFSTIFKVIGDVIGGILRSLGGLLDFITGIFSGNWKKAWQGICDYFGGIWDSIWGVVKGFINLIIDGINGLWTGIYTAVSGIVNAVGGIAGALGSLFGQNWSFSMPESPPLIPKLAKGGIVTAPTLAIVGDNAGANSGNPEVVAPLNKLQGMINSSSGEEVVVLSQILSYLKRIYEMFVIFKNNGGNSYEFVASLNGQTLFNEFVKEVNLYKLRHNGVLPF